MRGGWTVRMKASKNIGVPGCDFKMPQLTAMGTCGCFKAASGTERLCLFV